MHEETIFEKIINGTIPCYKVYESDSVLAFLALPQKTKGHTLVVPKRHSRNILTIEEKDFLDVMRVTRILSKHIYTKLGATGLQIQQNNEVAGGQEVFHTHFHIIPRYSHENVHELEEPLSLTPEELEHISREIRYVGTI
jgi:histidine triad (HIT) family protein